LPGVSLRQREWDGADGQKQKHVEGASNKMRFDGGIDLFFHFLIFSVFGLLNCTNCNPGSRRTGNHLDEAL